MTTAHYTDEHVRLYHGDCIEVMRQLPDASVDAVVTDPPYELGFMGKHWDGSGIAYRVDLWRQCLRVMKPGAHLLAFGGTRTWHRLACAIEDAGLEVRDSIAWMYGSGFPKSLDVSKAMDKAAGAEREVLREASYALMPDGDAFGSGINTSKPRSESSQITAPATDLARKWQGWGTALKPAFEPVVVARKPLVGTVAANVERYGTGALNIDGARVSTDGEVLSAPRSDPANRKGLVGKAMQATGDMERNAAAQAASIERTNTLGRWPANVILDESQAAELDRQSGVFPPSARTAKGRDYLNEGNLDGHLKGLGHADGDSWGYTDTGGASRFFYTAKADSSERPRVDGVAHPTVKPLDLMRYLVRLVTPPGGVVLEPFAGSGTTLEACIVEGFRCIGIEREADYIPLIMQRITKPIEPVMF